MFYELLEPGKCERRENSMVSSSRPSLDSQIELLDVYILSKHPYDTIPYKPSPNAADRQHCKARNTASDV